MIIDNIDAIDAIATLLLAFGTGLLIGAVLYIINSCIRSVFRGY